MAIGLFTYQVEAIYGTGTILSNSFPLAFDPIVPYDLPFMEAWNAGNYTDQNWITTAGNWIISDTGYPAPSASFDWSPEKSDYEEYLTSYHLNGRRPEQCGSQL